MIKWKYLDEDKPDYDMVGYVGSKRVDIIYNEPDKNWGIMYAEKKLTPKFKTREKAKEWLEDAEYNGLLTVSKQIYENISERLLKRINENNREHEMDGEKFKKAEKELSKFSEKYGFTLELKENKGTWFYVPYIIED